MDTLYRAVFAEPKGTQISPIPVFFLRLLLRLCCLLRWQALAFVLLWCGVGAMQLAHAHDHIVERSWLEDTTGQMAWPQVQQQAMQPFDETLSRGYGTGVVWLRLRIDPQANHAPATATAADGLVLRIRPAYLDDVVVFDPLMPGGRVGAVGDLYHPRLDVLQGADFLMPIARGDAPRDVWLRLTSTSTRQIHVAAIARSDLDALSLRQNLLVSLYMGVVIVLMVWGLSNSLLLREGVTGVMGAFALMQLTAGLFGLSTSGILRVFWPLAWSAQSLNLLGSVFAVVVVVGGLLFHWRFLREFQPPRWVMGLLLSMMALAGFNLLLLALGQVMWALENNIVSILLAPPVCLVCAATGRAWAAAEGASAPALSRRILVTFYVAFLIIMVIAATTGLGWLPPTEWTLYISQLQTLVSSALLMLMLQYRAFTGGQQRQQALLSLEKTTLQMAHERHMREDQEKLMAMLAHEIKTPLATMHLRLDSTAKGGLAMRKAMRDMDGVIERCLQTLQLGDGQLAPRLQMCDLAGIVQDAVSSCPQPAQVQVHWQPLASVPLQTDPQLLFLVLSNLLENACKYSAAETPIELQCSVVNALPAKPMVRLQLSNLPGKAGWPDEAHVFDKYYRSPQAQRQSGTGLGLYLVKNLAQALGGQVGYQPDATAVRFVLTLPLPHAP